MFGQMNNSKEERTGAVVSCIILCLAAIQNRFFDELVSIGGMDAISLLLTAFLLLAFISQIVKSKFRFRRMDFILLFYFLIITVIGFVGGGLSSSTLLQFRTAFYFFATFYIFSSIAITSKSVINNYKLAGITNVLVCLYFYFKNC